MGELPAQRPSDVTLLDLEASIEHLSRGTLRNVDALLVVTEPYYRSLETTGRIIPLARELGLHRIWVVANKVRSERDEAAIRDYCRRHGFELLAVVPFDENVTAADNAGRALIEYAPTSTAVDCLTRLAERLVERFEAPSPVAD